MFDPFIHPLRSGSHIKALTVLVNHLSARAGGAFGDAPVGVFVQGVGVDDGGAESALPDVYAAQEERGAATDPRSGAGVEDGAVGARAIF